MPDNPAVLLMESTAAFAPVLLSVQAGLFLLLLLAVSFCDIRSREIPDSLQLSIAALTILCFTPENLLGILGALPYLVAALFFGGADGIGGGDIKLAASTGLVFGLAASLTASLLGRKSSLPSALLFPWPRWQLFSTAAAIRSIRHSNQTGRASKRGPPV